MPTLGNQVAGAASGNPRIVGDAVVAGDNEICSLTTVSSRLVVEDQVTS